MLFIDVLYKDKDKVKKLGAKWNPNLGKKWHIVDIRDYYKFAPWIERDGNTVAIDNLYLIEGTTKCSHCGKDTRIIGFGVDRYLSVDTAYNLLEDDEKTSNDITKELNEELYSRDLHVIESVDPIPEILLNYIQSKYNYKLKYSRTTRRRSFSNYCDHCDNPQGDFSLFDETPNPFLISSPEDVQKLKIYSIKLKYDMIFSSAFVACTNYDKWFKEYGTIIPLDIEI